MSRPPIHRSLDRRVVAVCLLCVVAALAGCNGAFGDDGGLPDSDEIAETYESLDAYSAEFVFTFSSSNETADSRRTEGRLVLRPGTGEAYQRVYRSNGSGATFVSNGTVRWSYNETTNEVTRGEARQDGVGRRPLLRRVVNRIKMNESDGSGSAGLPLVPLGPGIGTGSGTDSGSTGGLDISTTASYEGTERVGDREAHVLTVESAGDSETGGRWTYYLDTEWYVLLGSTTNLTVAGERTESRFRLRNVTFDPEVPADRFEFTPPENATIVDSEGTEYYESREQLADAANLSVPDPEVPARFEFDGAQRFTYDGGTLVESVSLGYTSDVAELTVSRRNITSVGPPGESEQPVQVGDRTGTYRQFPRQNQVRWQCPETTQSVTGPLPRGTLVEIAESIEC